MPLWRGNKKRKRRLSLKRVTLWKAFVKCTIDQFGNSVVLALYNGMSGRRSRLAKYETAGVWNIDKEYCARFILNQFLLHFVLEDLVHTP